MEKQVMADESPPSQHKCRICMSEFDTETTDQDSQYVSPCECTGTMEFVHRSCLKQWIEVKKSDSCEVCNQKYNLPLRVVRYMTYSEYVESDPSSLVQLMVFVGAMAVLILLASLIFGWIAIFRILKHMIMTGSRPDSLSQFFCGPSVMYAMFVSCCGTAALTFLVVHVHRFRVWIKEHGAVYELVI